MINKNCWKLKLYMLMLEVNFKIISQYFIFFYILKNNNFLLAKRHFNKIIDAILKADKDQPGNNLYLKMLITWIDQKELLEVEKSEDCNLGNFISKYYEADDISAFKI